MDESKSDRGKRIKIFIQDPQKGVVLREGASAGENGDFLFIINERGEREGIAKRLILRFLEVA